MLTAGSGITPVMSMIRTLIPRRPDADVVLINSNSTPEKSLFRGELEELADQFPSPRALREIERLDAYPRRDRTSDAA